MPYDGQIGFSELFAILRDTFLIGNLIALCSLIFELAYFKWEQRKLRDRQQKGVLQRRHVFEFVN